MNVCFKLLTVGAMFATQIGCGSDQSAPRTLETPVSVEVRPNAATISPGQTLKFTAAVTGGSPEVVWSVKETGGGTITSQGVYTPPSEAGIYHVVASSMATPTAVGSATVAVTVAPQIQVSVSPRIAAVAPLGQLTFSATITGTPNTTVVWSIAEGPACGTITDAGVYKAPSTSRTCSVVATSAADNSKRDTATVNVVAPVRVSISPPSASVVTGGQVGFTASVTGSANTGVTWSIAGSTDCGSISNTGVYTAPNSPRTCSVAATSVADPSAQGTASIAVHLPANDLASQLSVLSTKSIYFGHQSVGRNVLDGLQTLLNQNTGPEPRILSTSSASQLTPGTFAESYNGSNSDPLSKISGFDATIRSGVGTKADIAFFKYCWVDFDADVTYFSAGGTVQSLFNVYKARLDALKAAYPGVRFVHFTTPLFTDTPMNARRAAYNDLVRSTYLGVEPVFDLALLESTRPDGSREVGRYGPALYSGYTSDGGHLNATGQDMVARALVAFLAGLSN